MHGKLSGLFIALFLLTFGVPVVSAEAGRNMAPLEQARRDLREIEGRIRVTRNAGEFVSEIDLFDNHLYGRLDSRRDRAHAGLLREMIRARNVELNRIMDNVPPGRTGEAVLTPDDTQFYEAVSSLQSEIARMVFELNNMERAAAKDVTPELMHGSPWVGERGETLLRDTLVEDLQKALGRARFLVDSLDNSAKSLTAPARALESKNEIQQ